MNKLDPFDEVEDGSDQEGMASNHPPLVVTGSGQELQGGQERKVWVYAIIHCWFVLVYELKSYSLKPSKCIDLCFHE